MLRQSKCSAGAALLGLVLSVACAPVGVRTGALPEDHPPPPEGMSVEAWVHARAAHQRATGMGLTTRTLVTIIDYSLPSTERRLWLVDLGTSEVLMNEHVAHGMGSGGTWATAFSNRAGSAQSSLGTFVTGATYSGVRGIAVRLSGLEPGINDRAQARGIVVHGTPNVSAERARRGQLGRTEGCPAVSRAAARRLVRLIAGGTVVFAWYPEKKFLAKSEYLDRTRLPVVLSNIE
ncbi:MAG: murein L,D-transpeptidase catalytic domain family protein [Gemmatimonadales bacterium]